MSFKKLRFFALLYIAIHFFLITLSSVEASELGKFKPLTLQTSGLRISGGIEVDKYGNIYVLDSGSTCVRKFKADGTKLISFCTGDPGKQLGGIAVDASGNIYVSSRIEHIIYKLNSGGTLIKQWGSEGTGNGQFKYPRGIAIDDTGNVYVADSVNNRIQKFAADGTYITQFGQMGYPADIALDKAGNMYITNTFPYSVKKLRSDGTDLSYGWKNNFNLPEGIAVDPNGNIYVADKNNGRIQKFTSDGEYLAQWGAESSLDGKFIFPSQLAIDTAGNLYVIEGEALNQRVQKMTPLPSDANLSSLKIGTFTIPLSSNNQVTVGNDVSMLTITATALDPLAAINIEGKLSSTGTLSYQTNLDVGSNIIPIVVTAQDGRTKKTYTLTVVRLTSTDASLKALTINHGTLSPAFSANQEMYTVQVEHAVSSIQITASPTNDGAKVAVNNKTSSETVELVVGETTIPIVVTAQDGKTQKTYTLTVTRVLSEDATLKNLTVSEGTLNPAFSANEENYMVQVGNDVTTLDIAASTTDSQASMTINGNVTTSETIALVAGQPTTIPIVVTAQDGKTQKTYTLTVTRALSEDATLQKLSVSEGILSPVFKADEENYTLQVEHNVTMLDVEAVTTNSEASVTINGKHTALDSIELLVGQAKTVSIVVTAPDGKTQKTYTLTVARAPSSDVTLQTLTVDQGILNPSFQPTINRYTIQPDLATSTIQVTALPTNVDASVMINGKTTTTDTITIIAGETMTIPIIVTAQNGEQGVYTLLVQEPSIPVTSVIVQPTNLQLQLGGSPVALTATIFPANAGNQNVSWRSNNPTVATVDQNGMVTPKSAGVADIIVTTIDGSRTATAQITVEQVVYSNEPTPSSAPIQEPVNDNDYSPSTPVNIIFHTNGGTVIEPMEVIYNTKLSNLPIPTREGYRFAGWYQDKELTKPWDKGMLVKESFTLYAKWTALPVEEAEAPKDSQAPKTPQPLPPIVTFQDIENHWAQEIIEALATQGIITGYKDGTFRPNETISRQHVAVLLTRAFTFEASRPTIAFTDVAPHHPYYHEITILQQAGIIDGVDGAFHPTDQLTRAQLAKILANTLQLQPQTTSSFTDVDSSHWSAEYIGALERAGIALGDNGEFRLEASVTRAQLAAFLYRAMQQ
ncbi:cadherin-like beta sandwich domain-containing protein [Lysinibacillus mangiferihumi]|uniref:cadherin-like beta sandwich domain-containing protein n=1 Tax=Lysinibacillus mangiferihumi TaxID=1130819 RepID=UPI00142D5EB6|nr:cadherin-like beta sandwich domain-containing protein [Lysinibacillus mangiferihumi]